MDQMALALPSRDYYLKASSEGDMVAYHKYMTNIAILLGANKTTASDELQQVVEFERRLANVRNILLKKCICTSQSSPRKLILK